MAVILIKKYGNRRLYDTGDSRYITLDELAVKIRSGLDVRIVDAQTNEDLTQATLVQLVMESGNAAKFLPVQLLTQMIRLSDDALAEFFSRYVTGALDVYLQARRGAATLASYNPLAQWMGGAMGGGFGYPPPQQSAYPPYPAAGSGPLNVAPPPPDEPVAQAAPGEVAAMRSELDELKQMLRESLATKPAKKSKKRS